MVVQNSIVYHSTLLFQLQKRLVKWRQRFVKKKVLKSSGFCDKAESFVQNFASMWSKHVYNNVWGECRFPVSEFAPIAKTYGSPTRVTMLKVAPNLTDPISLNEKLLQSVLFCLFFSIIFYRSYN